MYFSHTHSLTGWKLGNIKSIYCTFVKCLQLLYDTGWAYAAPNLIRNLQIAHQNCTYMCQTPEQEAAGAALEIEIERLGSEQSYFHKLTKDLVNKRDDMVNAIKDAGLIPVVPEGGYFILVFYRTLIYRTL